MFTPTLYFLEIKALYLLITSCALVKLEEIIGKDFSFPILQTNLFGRGLLAIFWKSLAELVLSPYHLV